MMTLEEWKIRFATWQQKEKWRWYVDDEGFLDTIHYSSPDDCLHCCPITAEFGRGNIDFPECAAALDLDSEAMHEIMGAADNEDEHDPILREWLLETCGIQESEAA